MRVMLKVRANLQNSPSPLSQNSVAPVQNLDQAFYLPGQNPHQKPHNSVRQKVNKEKRMFQQSAKQG